MFLFFYCFYLFYIFQISRHLLTEMDVTHRYTVIRGGSVRVCGSASRLEIGENENDSGEFGRFWNGC
jgi:hypothetical protein